MGFRRHMSALAEDEEKKQREIDISDWKLFKWVVGYLGQYLGLTLLGLFLIILSSVVSLISPLVTRSIIDNALGDRPTLDGDPRLLLYLTLLLLGVTLITALISYFRQYVLYKIGFQSIKTIRSDAFESLQDQSLEYFDKHELGRTISKITNDCDRINEFMSGGIIGSLVDFLTLIGITVVLLVLNWGLALWVFLFSVPLTLIISFIFRIRARRAYRKTRKTIATVTANLSESISGVKVSKSFTREKRNIRDFKDVNYENRKANLKATAVFATTFPLFHFLSAAVTAFVYLYGAWSVNFMDVFPILTQISIGTAIAFTQYIGNFFRPILNLTMFYNTFQSTMAASERVYELISHEPAVHEAEDAYDLPKIEGHVVFKNVEFSYKEDEVVLPDFSIDVKPGESIAIVGPTGAGKTTITNLLARFYEIDNGSILIDGHNIQDITLESLREQMGVVLQDPYLFTGSIKENIAYNHKGVSREEIIQTAKAVNAHEFIERMPKKYETNVGERGGRLSLGQRQLISFARALLPDPKILILDEATSSVDPYTELLIKDAMKTLLSNRTSFIIAHRLSTVRNADRIIVIEDGEIIEEGTNEELLAKKGEYYRLYQLQFKEQEELNGKLSA
ncbi:MAG: ABC transporter ATP-binding protein [Asgard group archaeon]|nr:ABC transporter ATP-binding protein [Asgard group archaeon]